MSDVPAPLAAGLAEATGRAVAAGRRVGGGDINDAWRIELADGGAAFVKTRPDAPAGEYATEAAGLRWLAETAALPVARVLAWRDPDGPVEPETRRWLALEWVDRGGLDAAGRDALGRGLAALHGAGAPAFGASPPGAPAGGAESPPLRLGPLRLPNEPLADWPSFYAERRLRPLVAKASESGALTAAGRRAVERVCERIDDLAGPPEPPARLHGDLWSGNVLAGADGCPWLIDPAAYGGHREVDLAMLALFGGGEPRVLDAYQDVHPLAPGHADRVALWQLFPLLVHAVLFGGGYGDAVERAARRYVS